MTVSIAEERYQQIKAAVERVQAERLAALFEGQPRFETVDKFMACLNNLPPPEV